jgi:predicted TIM-barrel fold metal-dependent hydrolase
MIDAHLHLIEPNRFHYPWLLEVPQLAEVYDLKRHRQEDAHANFTGYVVVEGDVVASDQIAEANYLCALARDPQHKILGVIAACRPQQDQFADFLTRIADPKLVGVRRVLHVVADSTSQDVNFRRNIASLEGHNLSFDLCVRANQLALAFDLARTTPHTRFILDHCGNPPLENEVSMQLWRDDIGRLAALENVSCKVSGLVNHLLKNQRFLALRPILDHVSVHFGWDRILFGSDWPICLLAQPNLHGWVKGAEALLETQAETTRRDFFSNNAKRLYELH